MCRDTNNLKQIIHSIVLVMLLLFSLFGGSCSRTEPKINYGFISLTYYQNQGKIQERFSFFIIPEDEDGLENLDVLLLYHDREQLRWKLTSADWMIYTHEDRTWIGSWNLAIDGEENFPRGQYRAVLINKGGERTQRNFTFDAPAESRFPFPSLEISDNQYTVTSSYPNNRFVCYDAEGNYLSTVAIPALSGSLESLRLNQNIRFLSLWAEDSAYFTSAFTESVYLR